MIINPFHPQRKRNGRYFAVMWLLIIIIFVVIILTAYPNPVFMDIKFGALFWLNAVWLIGSVLIMPAIVYNLRK